MKVNQKAVKVLEKLFEAKYTNERAISGLTIDQILALRGVSVSDIAMINELQKKIKGHEVLSFFRDEPPKQKDPSKPQEHEEPHELHDPYDTQD